MHSLAGYNFQLIEVIQNGRFHKALPELTSLLIGAVIWCDWLVKKLPEPKWHTWSNSSRVLCYLSCSRVSVMLNQNVLGDTKVGLLLLDVNLNLSWSKCGKVKERFLKYSVMVWKRWFLFRHKQPCVISVLFSCTRH